jgi:beta-glucosidase
MILSTRSARPYTWAALGVVSIAAVALLGASQRPKETPGVAPYRNPSAPLELRVQDLLHRMTLEEKVRQLDMYAGAKEIMNEHADDTHAGASARFDSSKAQLAWGSLGVGSIHDLHPTPRQYNTVQAWVIAHNRLGIPALFIEEGLHGYDTGTVFPAPIGLAATWDPTVAEQTAAAIAAEARANGVDMILAPVLDIARDPRWGRVEEDFGEDPYLTGQMGLAYVRGAQGDDLATDHTVVAEPKHFVGHGSPEGGTNTSPVHMGERELRTVMLRAFEPAIRQGHAMAVMAAYHEIDGIPMTADPMLLKDVLRDEWGFKGFVLSDLGAIQRLYSAHHVAASPQDAACLAIRSGVDMQFYDFDHNVFEQALVDCVHQGSLSMDDINRAAGAVLRVKFMLGLFDHPMVDPALVQRVWRSPAYLAVSLRSARESITLLKNENHLLPLSKSVAHIAVIGPNGNIARYGDYEEPANGEHISVLQGIRAEVPDAQVTFNEGADLPGAVALARSADVVVMALGENHGISGEGFDRSELGLPGNQEQLLEAVAATGKPIIMVLENGRPLAIGWAKQHIPAILEAWYPGEFGGKAIAQTLFGENNPSGHLTISFPQSAGTLPDYYNVDPSRQWKYIDSTGKSLFAFGLGLSYTTFTYTGLTVSAPPAGEPGDIVASVTVTNTGTLAGDAVPQLYMREDTSSVETPVRQLEAFRRIHLAPGSSQVVSFQVPTRQLAVWNAERRWSVEPGAYTAWAGDSSQASLRATFRLR